MSLGPLSQSLSPFLARELFLYLMYTKEKKGWSSDEEKKASKFEYNKVLRWRSLFSSGETNGRQTDNLSFKNVKKKFFFSFWTKVAFFCCCWSDTLWRDKYQLCGFWLLTIRVQFGFWVSLLSLLNQVKTAVGRGHRLLSWLKWWGFGLTQSWVTRSYLASQMVCCNWRSLR